MNKQTFTVNWKKYADALDAYIADHVPDAADDDSIAMQKFMAYWSRKYPIVSTPADKEKNCTTCHYRFGKVPMRCANCAWTDNFGYWIAKDHVPDVGNKVPQPEKEDWISVEDEFPIDDYNNQFRLLCYYPSGNDVGSNYKIVWTFNFKSEIGVSHWMPLPKPPHKPK